MQDLPHLPLQKKSLSIYPPVSNLLFHTLNYINFSSPATKTILFWREGIFYLALTSLIQCSICIIPCFHLLLHQIVSASRGVVFYSHTQQCWVCATYWQLHIEWYCYILNDLKFVCTDTEYQQEEVTSIEECDFLVSKQEMKPWELKPYSCLKSMFGALLTILHVLPCQLYKLKQGTPILDLNFSHQWDKLFLINNLALIFGLAEW